MIHLISNGGEHMDVTIRELYEHDSIDLLSLINNELGYPDITLDDLTSHISQMKKAGNYYNFVALSSNKTVGYISIVQGTTLELKGDTFRIIGMAVSAAYQGKGIGGLLLRHIEEIASERGISSIKLSSKFQRHNAHAFYEKNGYIKTSYAFAKSI